MNDKDIKIIEWIDKNLNKNKLFDIVHNFNINFVYLILKEDKSTFATIYKDKVWELIKKLELEKCKNGRKTRN